MKHCMTVEVEGIRREYTVKLHLTDDKRGY